MNLDWDKHEISLQILKNIINFNSPRKRLILLNQSSKRATIEKWWAMKRQ
jgi:hypothetical protein